MEKKLANLRGRGWRVAVHNDYRQSGADFTFWLFTHVDGRWVRGEGRTDDEALTQCLASIAPRCDCVDGHEPFCRAAM